MFVNFFDFKSRNGSAQVREKKDKLLFSNQLARLKQVTNKECSTFWQMLNKQTFKHPGCFENIHTFHLGVEKFKFQGEECKWCSEDLSRKKHKQHSYEDAINKQMEHFLVKFLVSQALWKKLHLNKELSWDLSSSDIRELIRIDNYLIFQKKYSGLRQDKDFDWKTIPIARAFWKIQRLNKSEAGMVTNSKKFSIYLRFSYRITYTVLTKAHNNLDLRKSLEQ